jgi:hypothetical protein
VNVLDPSASLFICWLGPCSDRVRRPVRLGREGRVLTAFERSIPHPACSFMLTVCQSALLRFMAAVGLCVRHGHRNASHESHCRPGYCLFSAAQQPKYIVNGIQGDSIY